MTPRLIDVIDVFNGTRHHSSGAAARLDECQIEHWGLSLRSSAPENPLHDEEVTWLLSEYGLRLTRYRQRRRHARGGPTLITAVCIDYDVRSWTITDLLLGLEVPDYGPIRVSHPEDFGAAIAGGLIRSSEAEFALRTVHRVLAELAVHRDINDWLASLDILDPW